MNLHSVFRVMVTQDSDGHLTAMLQQQDDVFYSNGLANWHDVRPLPVDANGVVTLYPHMEDMEQHDH